MRGNVLPLLKSPATVAKVRSSPSNSPVRKALEESGFGLVLYHPEIENGCSDGLIEMQAKTLTGFVKEYDSDKARGYAVFDLHSYSKDVMLGKVSLN